MSALSMMGMRLAYRAGEPVLAQLVSVEPETVLRSSGRVNDAAGSAVHQAISRALTTIICDDSVRYRRAHDAQLKRQGFRAHAPDATIRRRRLPGTCCRNRS